MPFILSLSDFNVLLKTITELFSDEGILEFSSKESCMAYAKYEAQAILLRDSDEAKYIANLIFEYYGKNCGSLTPNIFFAVGAPSGSGKTQLAFVLRSLNFNVMHATLSSNDEMSQLVYVHSNIFVFSSHLSKAIAKDLTRFPPSQFVNVYDLAMSTFTSHTVALLSCAFSIFDADKMVIVTVISFRKAINKLFADTGRLPVLVVDEAFQGQNDLSMIPAVFLRSLARACGLVSIFMGTTVDTTRFIRTRTYSATEVEVREWCLFISNLPKLNIDPSEIDKIKSVVVKSFVQMLQQSHQLTNPRAMQFLCACAQEGDGEMTLQDALNKMTNKFRRQKLIALSAVGVRAQLHYQLDDKNVSEKVAATLVMAHYAFYHKNVIVCLMSGKVVVVKKDGWEHWQPVPNFPTCFDDPLLALILGGFCLSQPTGCEDYFGSYPFLAAGMDISHVMNLTSAAAYLLVWAEHQHTEVGRIVVANRNAKKRNGNLLENIASLAIINASRVSGIGGCKVSDFIRGVVIELQPLAVSLSCGNPNELSRLWSQTEHKIPFVARTENDDVNFFPGNCSNIGLHVGVFFRPEDSECVDGIGYCNGDVFLLAEMKNLDNKQPSQNEIVKNDDDYLTIKFPNSIDDISEVEAKIVDEGESEGEIARTVPLPSARGGSGGAGIVVVRKVLKAFNNHASKAVLGLVVVSKLANIRGAVDEVDLKDTAVVYVQVKDDMFFFIRLMAQVNTKRGGLRDMNPAEKTIKQRLLCIVECDQVAVLSTLNKDQVLKFEFNLLGVEAGANSVDAGLSSDAAAGGAGGMHVADTGGLMVAMGGLDISPSVDGLCPE
jgi:hypothetical protein